MGRQAALLSPFFPCSRHGGSAPSRPTDADVPAAAKGGFRWREGEDSSVPASPQQPERQRTALPAGGQNSKKLPAATAEWPLAPPVWRAPSDRFTRLASPVETPAPAPV